VNIPMLRDLDNDPGFYAAACGNADWTGASLFVSIDAGASYQNLLTFDTAATIGRTVDALGDFGGGNLPDELNAVTVRLFHGTLSSTDYAGLLAGAQSALIGDEIVHFRGAALNLDGSYTLTGFLRARRGTEQAMPVHAAGERFVLLDPAMLKRAPATTADIGISKLYKAVTVGATLAGAAAQTFVNAGAALKPYSVVQIGGGRNGVGDLLINWIRRGRMSGEWRNLVDVPVSETSESYQVDIWNADRSALLRTLTGLTAPTATYAAADQVTDGSSSAQVSVSVFQMSDTVGRGHGAHALLPGGATVAEIDPVTLALSSPPPPTGGPTPTLYVATTGSDSNSGTLAAPFLTIAHASSVAVPGDVISVENGTYTGGMYTNANGTLAAPITFIAATRWGARIVPPTSSSSIFAWDNAGAYNIIDGFEVDGSINPTSGTIWTVGIRVKGEGSVIQHCHSHHIYHSGVANSSGGSGLLLDSSDSGQNMKALGNRVHHIGPPTGGSAWYHGIYMTATGQIKNNLSYANAGGGIHCWHDARHIDIANNTSFANGGYGIIYGGGDYVHLSSPCDYMTVTNNIVYGNPTGIRELGDIGSHNLISTNLCYANGTDYSLSVSSHSGDIHADPLFMNYHADGSGDYHLQAGSPAINVGLSTYAPTVDYDGAVRPAGAGFDLGAYERA
jgi:hypothetical protein